MKSYLEVMRRNMARLEGSQGTRYPKSFTPFYSGVVLQLIPQTMTAGGLALPDRSSKDASDEAHRCWVIAIGEECKGIAEGDMVLLGNAPHMIIKFQGYDYIVTTQDRLAGKVVPPGA